MNNKKFSSKILVTVPLMMLMQLTTGITYASEKTHDDLGENPIVSETVAKGEMTATDLARIAQDTGLPLKAVLEKLKELGFKATENNIWRIQKDQDLNIETKKGGIPGTGEEIDEKLSREDKKGELARELGAPDGNNTLQSEEKEQTADENIRIHKPEPPILNDPNSPRMEHQIDSRQQEKIRDMIMRRPAQQKSLYEIAERAGIPLSKQQRILGMGDSPYRNISREEAMESLENFERQGGENKPNRADNANEQRLKAENPQNNALNHGSNIAPSDREIISTISNICKEKISEPDKEAKEAILKEMKAVSKIIMAILAKIDPRNCNLILEDRDQLSSAIRILTANARNYPEAAAKVLAKIADDETFTRITGKAKKDPAEDLITLCLTIERAADNLLRGQ